MQKGLSGQCSSNHRVGERICWPVPLDQACCVVLLVGDLPLSSSDLRSDPVACRYFLFHASLIPCVCIRADPQSLEARKLKGDIETTRWLLSTTFSDNPLASRALEVIQQILPNPAPTPVFPAVQEFNGDATDFTTMFPLDSSDPLSSFGWPDFGWVS